MDRLHEPVINQSTYDWSVRAFSTLRKLLSVNIKMHHEVGQIEAGDIFLFNHFARFETFIPQYLIHQKTGAYCRSVAAAEFFEGDDAFASYLYNVGAVPNNHSRLLPLLAEEILRGRKVVVFPEGGMVKDRKVMDHRGKFEVYSRTAKMRRKHHSGPAVLALVLDFFKMMICYAEARGDSDVVERWSGQLGFDDQARFMEAVRRPTSVVPANITFYPLQVGDNLLRQGASLFKRKLSRHMTEELLVEGNLLLKETDMDIRLGDLIYPARRWRVWDRFMARRFYRHITSFEDLFDMRRIAGSWDRRGFVYIMRSKSSKLRDDYMRLIYHETTANLSHIASTLILKLVESGVREIEYDRFNRIVYLALKYVQRQPHINLHRSLCNPDWYRGLLSDRSLRLERLFTSAANMGLVAISEDRFQFLEKLREEHAFDDVRLNNIIEVYANEAKPVAGLAKAVDEAVVREQRMSPVEFAQLRFDDEMIALNSDRTKFSKPRHEKINAQETATADPRPYLEVPKGATVGVLLVHGFLATPAELRGMADDLLAQGYAVMGVRLKGHGTSPWDLRERTWQDWLESVCNGYEILRAHVERVAVVGFSTGAALALEFAATHPDGLLGVVAASTPVKFRNKKLVFVPLVYGLNRLVRWAPSIEGVKVFEVNDSEHPTINYRNIPIRSLYELMKLVDEYTGKLDRVTAPVLIMQSDADPVVEPKSAQMLMDKLVNVQNKRLEMVASERHGILNEDIGGARGIVYGFVLELIEKSN